MSKPVKIVALLTARADRPEDLRSLLEGMIGPSRAEPGNLRYDLWQDQTSPLRFVLDELYADEAAVAAHRLTPHFKHYLSVINHLADRVAVVLEPVRVD
ncbi:putative quinol monooxygenase [Sphingobium sp.]|uniref:putative quinol monooxygenase n=1 Tax=Sphingobium sp. TaxID=1912891 RepID=UPI0026293291|nr:putative quinol monooxygenase [Sphingobium sp.]